MCSRVNNILGMKQSVTNPETDPETDHCTREADRCTREADRIQRFFVRPFFLSCTIGIPFCIFKLLFGLTALRIGINSSSILAWFGWFIIIWAATDLLMNVVISILDLFGRPAPFEYCTIAQIGRLVGYPLVFLAVDTFFSFAIICFMLWSWWITKLSTAESYLWFVATSLNLITLSVVSIYNEMRKESKEDPKDRNP